MRYTVRRDFSGGTAYQENPSGYFPSYGEAIAFTECLTGGGTWVLERFPTLTDAMCNGAQTETLASGNAQP